MGYGSSTDIGEELKGNKKIKIEELTPKELIRKERELIKKALVESQKFQFDGKIRLKKYGGNGLFNKAEIFIENWHSILLLLICLITGFLVLSQPAFMSGIEKNIQENVLSSLEKQINLKVDLDFPRVSKTERIKIAEQEFKKAKKDPALWDQIAKNMEAVKSYYKDKNGQPYIYGVDSYLFLREARNLLETGNTGDIFKIWPDGNRGWVNTLREAPKGTSHFDSFLSYLEYYAFKVMHIFGWSLEKTAFWLPLLSGLLSITLIFLIAKKITNPVGGFFSAFIFSMHQRFFALNYAGFADTNYLNLFFSLFLIFLFIHLLDFRVKKSIFCILFIIPTTYLFQWTWKGHFFVYVIILVFIICKILLYLIQNFKKSYNKILFGITLTAVCLASYFATLTDAFKVTYQRLMPYLVLEGTFRNGMANIVELQPVSFEVFFKAMGGYLLWILFLFALGYMGYICIRGRDTNYLLFLLVWFILTATAGMLSSRFLFYAAPSFSIIIGSGLSFFFPLLSSLSEISQVNIQEKTWKGIILVSIALILLFSVRGDILKLEEYRPPMNDAIYETAEFIKHNSDENTVLDTWWDAGYTYQYYAERGTIFDAGSFGGPSQYWVSRAFLSEDPSIGEIIFRMLNCANIKVETDIKNLSKIKNLATCSNPSLVIISEDMLGKIYEMKASIIDRDIVQDANYIKMLSKREAILYLETKFNLSQNDAQAKYPELLNFKDTAELVKVSRISKCFENNKIILCDNGYKIIGNEVTYKNQHPAKLYSYFGDKSQIVDYKDSKADFAFILYKVKDGIYSFMIETDLADTMIVRMFAGDKIEGFEEVYSTEYPVQIRTYTIK